MTTIRKTSEKATYLEGNFYLRDEKINWAHPINFPTIFVAYGAAIKSGNWQKCTSINTPQYVIDNYFNKQSRVLSGLWKYCFELEKITWKQVNENKDQVLQLINLANNELLKLKPL